MLFPNYVIFRTFAREASNQWRVEFWDWELQIQSLRMRDPLSYKMESRLPWGSLRQRYLQVQEIIYSL